MPILPHLSLLGAVGLLVPRPYSPLRNSYLVLSLISLLSLSMVYFFEYKHSEYIDISKRIYIKIIIIIIYINIEYYIIYRYIIYNNIIYYIRNSSLWCLGNSNPGCSDDEADDINDNKDIDESGKAYYHLYGECKIIVIIIKIGIIVIINIDIRDKLVITALAIIVVLNTPIKVIEIIIEVKMEPKEIIKQIEKCLYKELIDKVDLKI